MREEGTPISERTDWSRLAEEVHARIVRLRKKPVKLGYRGSPGSILNAYREGDLNFEEAVAAINGLQSQDKEALLAAAIKVVRASVNRHPVGHDALIGLRRAVVKRLTPVEAQRLLRCNCTPCANARRQDRSEARTDSASTPQTG